MIFYAAAVIFILLILFIAEYFFIKKILSNKITGFQNTLMNTYYEDVNSVYKKMRGWRHDYHNHIQVMKAYLEFKNYSGLHSYLDNLSEDLITLDSVIKTGNMMCDAILNTKISIALLHEITLNIKTSVPKNIPLTDLELCVIIGNLFDNAIEGCLTLSNPELRFIRIYIRSLNENLYIAFTNACLGKRKKKHGKFFTTKQGKDHGFGLNRIDIIVKKYAAFINRQSEDGVFAVEIMFPLKSSESF